MRGFLVPLNIPFTAAVAAWLAENIRPLHTATVWLPNQSARASLTKHLAALGIARLPHLRLLRAEDPDTAAPAPHILSQPALAAMLTERSQTNLPLAPLYNQQVGTHADWSGTSPTARTLKKIFDTLDTTLAQTGRSTLAAASADALHRASQTPGPHLVVGLFDAHGPALNLLQNLTTRDDTVFFFPDLPLENPTLASHPGAALSYLLGKLAIDPLTLQPLPSSDPLTLSPSHPLTLAVAPHPLAEATTIAHRTHHALQQQQTPIHIICPDTALRDLIAATLRTYGIAFTGKGPRLAHTPAGQLFIALAQAAASPEATPLATLSRLLNFHPALDSSLWRGIPAEGWDDWEKKLSTLESDELAPDLRPSVTADFVKLRDLLQPLHRPRPLASWITDSQNALPENWQQLPGGATLQRWLAQAADAPLTHDWSTSQFAAFVAQQLNFCHLPASAEGDVLLTGLLETRLLNAGTVIIAGANEGVWPGTSTPLLGDADCDRLGLPTARQQLRLTAAEWHLALHAAPHVFVTRSATNAQGPTQPSRFLQTTKTDPDTTFINQAQTQTITPQSLQRAGTFTPGDALLHPAWSASFVEDLAQCPYRALSKRRLHLKESSSYHADPTSEHHGLWVHRWLGDFWPAWQKPTIDDVPAAEALLLKLGQRELNRQSDIIRRLWQNRLPQLAAQLVAHWQGRKVIHTEIKLEGHAGDKKLNARADRIDSTPNGWRLIDYKTGGVPGWGEVKRGEKPQLLIEAVLAAQNNHRVEGVEYVKLNNHGKKLVESKPQPLGNLQEALDQTGPWLQALATRYAPQQTFPAAPVYGGGLQPRGHCERCAFGGICRWQEASHE